MQNVPSSRRAREIFEDALELSLPAEQAKFIDAACEGTPALKQRVLALMAAHEAARLLLPDTPEDLLPGGLNGEQPGDRIGRYQLIEKIGEGGCGVVYLAEQLEPLQRRVALKVIKLGMDSKLIVGRFAAERQALAMMEHPNIAQVFDAGATEAGRPYFVMELVKGLRLTEHCERYQLGLPERLSLFLPVCQAIQHAHQKGVIHRDIKPSNILVTVPGPGSSGVPKVIDFGIAKATEVRLTEHTLLTSLHPFIGTPAYMSPEQADLGGLNIDTRTDIYSLGVLLYELLTGETPFDPKTLLESGLDELRRTVREIQPLKPSARIMAQLARTEANGPPKAEKDRQEWAVKVRGDLDWIVMKCLEKDRTRRYETASELAQDVQRFLLNEPVLARPPSRGYLFKKLVQRNRGTFAALTAITLLLVGGIAFSTWQATRAKVAERLERDLRQKAQSSERRAEQAVEQARLQAYTSDMKSAASALEASNFGQAQDLLRRYFPKPGEMDLRGIEWRYLWQAARGDEVRSFSEDYFVNCAKLSIDGQWLALHTFNGVAHILQLSSGRTVATFPGIRERDTLDSLAFSPDGKVLAAANSQSIQIRDTRDWSLCHELGGPCEALAFSPDGSQLAVLNDAGVHLYAAADWREHQLLPAQGSGPGRLTFVGTNGVVAILRRNSLDLELWDLARSDRIARLTGGGLMLALAASPDGQWLAAGNSDGEMWLWDVTTRRLVFMEKAHPRWLHSLAFSPDGELLASAGGDQLIQLWEVSSFGQSGLKKRATLKGHRNEIWSVAFSADGSDLISGGKDGLAKLWSVKHPPASSAFFLEPIDGFVLGFLPNSREIVTLSGDPPALRVWDPAQNLIFTNLQVEPFGAVVFSPPYVFFGTTNGTIETWEVPAGKCVRRRHLTEGPVNSLAVSPDGKLLFGWERTRELASLWNLEEGERIATFPDLATAEAPASWSKSQRVAFSPNGRWLAYASSNYTVKLWDVGRRQHVRSLAGHSWHIECLRFSPEGTRLATGSWDAQVCLWDVDSGRLATAPLKGHLTGIANLAFSRDGRTLAVRSSDDLLHFWSTINGAEMFAVPHVTAWFFNVISPDGNALAWEPGPNSNRLRVQYLPTLTEIDSGERGPEQ